MNNGMMGSVGTNGTNHDGGGSDPSVALFEKWSVMQKETQNCRQQKDEIHLEIEKLKLQIEELQEKTAQEQQDSKAAAAKAAEFHALLDGEAPPGDEASPSSDEEKTSESALAQKEYSAAWTDYQNAEQALERWKQWKTESLLTFLEESRDFRSNCKLWRLKAAAHGLQTAAATAWTAVAKAKVPGATVVPTESIALESDDAGDRDRLSDPHEDDEHKDDDPSAWTADDDDEDLKKALDLYRVNKLAYDIACDELNDVSKKKQAAMHKSGDRLERKQRLEAQLSRIDKDNADLQSQIEQLQQLIEEDKAMADSYSKKLQGGRGAGEESGAPSQSSRRVSVAPNRVARNPYVPSASRVARNPYAPSVPAATSGAPGPSAATAVTPAPAASVTTEHHQPNKRRRQELSEIVLGRRTRPQRFSPGALAEASAESSDPVHTRVTASGHRLRRDRQFGVSLEITSEGSSSLANVGVPPPGSSRDGSHNPSAEDMTPGTPSAATAQQPPIDTDDDDDEEDDDALLSFHAFSK